MGQRRNVISSTRTSQSCRLRLSRCGDSSECSMRSGPPTCGRGERRGGGRTHDWPASPTCTQGSATQTHLALVVAPAHGGIHVRHMLGEFGQHARLAARLPAARGQLAAARTVCRAPDAARPPACRPRRAQRQVSRAVGGIRCRVWGHTAGAGLLHRRRRLGACHGHGRKWAGRHMRGSVERGSLHGHPGGGGAACQNAARVGAAAGRPRAASGAAPRPGRRAVWAPAAAAAHNAGVADVGAACGRASAVPAGDRGPSASGRRHSPADVDHGATAGAVFGRLARLAAAGP